MRLLAVSLAVLAARAPSDELERRLADLSAPSALLRSQAQAWLGTHVQRADFPRLAATARGADAEVRGRLASALAEDDRHLGLAVLFAEEHAPELAALGQRALEDAAVRWSEKLAEPPVVGDELVRRLARLARNAAAPPVTIDLALPLVRNLDLLRRHGVPMLGVVADPELVARPGDDASHPRPVSGGWDALLLELAREHGLGLDGFGLEDLDAPPPLARRWLRFAPLRRSGRETGAALFARWCLRVAQAGAHEERRAAARALAAAGWPAALGWLEERWLEQRDAAALDGLLVAASCGRVVPVLARAETLRELCASAERALAEGALERATELLYAVAAAGCLDAEGGELVPVLLEGWPASSLRGRWWRLAVLEQLGCTLAPGAPGESLLRGLLADPATPPELLLQALRAWCVVTAGAARTLELVDARPLIERARRVDQARELLALLERADVPPPAEHAALLDPTGFLPAWCLAFGRLEPAAEALLGALRSGALERVRELLDDACARGQGERVLATLMRAREQAGAGEANALEALAFRLGLLAGPPLERFLEGQGPLAELPDRLLGALAAWTPEPGAEEARKLLLARLQAALGGGDGLAPQAELAQAIEEALAGLYARGFDVEAGLLVARARRLLETYFEARLARELVQAGFPVPPRAAPLPLAWRERGFDPATLGR